MNCIYYDASEYGAVAEDVWAAREHLGPRTTGYVFFISVICCLASFAQRKNRRSLSETPLMITLLFMSLSVNLDQVINCDIRVKRMKSHIVPFHGLCRSTAIDLPTLLIT